MGESFYQQVHRLRDGAVMVYRRGDTNQQVYQARLKVPGVTGYIIRSLKTRDLPKALNQAEDLLVGRKVGSSADHPRSTAPTLIDIVIRSWRAPRPGHGPRDGRQAR